MRNPLYPVTSLERDFKFYLINSFLKLLFILGIAFLVFVLTSKTYVPATGMSNSYERVPQAIDTPPVPFASSGSY